MTSRPPRFPLFVATFALWVSAAANSAAWAQADRTRGDATERQADGPVPFLFGERYCAQCHAHPENYKIESVICRMDESLTWGGKDKHKLAYAVLKSPRGQEMGKRLEIDVTADRACLSCHSIVFGGVENAAKNDLLAGVKVQQFDRQSDGVSCVACHGPYREWVLEHSLYEDPQWRNRSRADKERRAGMVDLWDPVTRARTCVSCHVGNAGEGKLLTHAMYAAGHPPLPGIEIAAFSDAMPYHWEYLGEKRTGRRPEVLKALEKALDLGKLERTELVAVSGLVPLRESLALFVAQADTVVKTEVPGARWPDFARFDCYACHHDVRQPSWRLQRGFADVPGRPPAPAWPTTLVVVAVEALDPAGAPTRLGDYTQGLRAFHKALGAQPFGQKALAVSTARRLIAWADDAILLVGRTKIDRATALRMLDRICRAAKSEIPDYDSARQLFWAFRTIYDEITPSPRIPGAITAEALNEFGAALGFSFPSARVQEPIEKTLTRRLRAVTDFDPAAFQDRFSDLAKHLPRQ